VSSKCHPSRISGGTSPNSTWPVSELRRMQRELGNLRPRHAHRALRESSRVVGETCRFSHAIAAASRAVRRPDFGSRPSTRIVGLRRLARLCASAALQRDEPLPAELRPVWAAAAADGGLPRLATGVAFLPPPGPGRLELAAELTELGAPSGALPAASRLLLPVPGESLPVRQTAALRRPGAECREAELVAE